MIQVKTEKIDKYYLDWERTGLLDGLDLENSRICATHLKMAADSIVVSSYFSYLNVNDYNTISGIIFPLIRRMSERYPNQRLDFVKLTPALQFEIQKKFPDEEITDERRFTQRVLDELLPEMDLTPYSNGWMEVDNIEEQNLDK